MARIALAQHPTHGEIAILAVSNGLATVLIGGMIAELPYRQFTQVLVNGETIDNFGVVVDEFGVKRTRDMVALLTGTQAWADTLEIAWSMCNR